jgi:hypothetical protein
MNERIKQLKQQAGIDYNPDQEGLDLFAELIVRECMDIAYDHTPNTEECEYKRLIHNKIKQHFGVEE